MRHRSLRQTRRGAVLALVALCLVALIGLLALAIDIGMIAIARCQCQNSADAAAMAGARTISGNSGNNYNFSAVPTNAVKGAIANQVLSNYVQGNPAAITTVNAYTFSSGQVSIEVGAYTYAYDDANPSNEGFKILFPRTDTTEPYSAVRATVSGQSGAAFSRIFGMTAFNTGATAVAVHRPRDVIIIMDLSGSMRFQSLPGIPTSSGAAAPSSQSRPRVLSMNPESVFPKFGHYFDTAGAALQGSSSLSTGTEMVDPANVSSTTNSGPPILADFTQNTSGTLAFTRAPDTQDVTPGGYNYLKFTGDTGANYAVTVNDILGSTSYNQNWETNGYDQYVSAKPVFYTEGPGYWGKTFFIWPPDPRGSFLDATNAANHADNGAKDWRQRFFFKVTSGGTLGWLDHNTILFDTSGQPATNSTLTPTPVLRTPGTSVSVTENGSSVSYSYRINYAAIFHWLRNQDPKPFPTQIKTGRINYYDAIPDPSDTTLNNRFWTTATLTNLNERFWKSYIDFVLGLKGTGAGTYSRTQSSVPLSALLGNGDFYKWGTTAIQLTAKPDVTTASAAYQSGLINNGGGYASGYSGAITVKNMTSTPVVGDYVYLGASTTRYRVKTVGSITSITLDKALSTAAADSATVKLIQGNYMSYTDNPYRPRHQYWFGPMTWVDWLGNYNTNQFWWPGNIHEAQCWACKVGIQTAIDDIKNNHPNDFIGMAYFSSPQYSTSGSGDHNCAVVPLGRNYQQLKDSLWFPPTTVTGTATEITPYDTDFLHVPRAKGGTCPGMGFMVSYNLLSSSTANLRFYSQPQPQYRGNAGGLGRKGAQRTIIFETDGAPNVRGYATLGGSGSDSYYKIRLTDPANFSNGSNVEWPSGGSYVNSEVYDVVKQICALETASPPGYGTSRKPATVHSIGYGSLFDPANPSAAQSAALTFLQTVAYYGNTAPDTNGSSFPDDRRIYGTNTQRINRIQAAFTEIMQSGVQVSLIE